MFLRNEPTVLEDGFWCNSQCIRCLRLKTHNQIGGFVLENEPTGEVFWGVKGEKWVRF